MNLPFFLADETYNDLLEELIVAGGNPEDAHAAVAELLSEWIAPEGARADIVRHAATAERYEEHKLERDAIGREIAALMAAHGVTEDDEHMTALLD